MAGVRVGDQVAAVPPAYLGVESPSEGRMIDVLTDPQVFWQNHQEQVFPTARQKL